MNKGFTVGTTYKYGKLHAMNPYWKELGVTKKLCDSPAADSEALAWAREARDWNTLEKLGLRACIDGTGAAVAAAPPEAGDLEPAIAAEP